ncbi:hypothetical protein EM308_12485 [Flavobacterium gilvum]|uniref:PKD domain-containing protein n=3 Tax=Flavobacterium gilvum TaxID=1492737 RepID=A0AAC9N5T4_9FLAO|nr:hypothetical protein EM308_12485 [Flavobacterium gilvum]
MANLTPSNSPACPPAGCTANDVKIGEVYIADASGNRLTTCTSGNPISGQYLWVRITDASSKYGLYMQFNMYRGTQEIDQNGNQISDGNINKITVGDNRQIIAGNYRMMPLPSYTCGDFLTLKNIYLSWQTPPGGQATTVTPECATTSKCSAENLPNTIIVNTPLAVSFSTVNECTSGAYQQVTFTNTSTGGDGTLTYLWNFGDGANPSTSTASGNSSTPIIVTYLTGGTKNITLTITDADGDTAMQSGTVSVGTCCTIAINSISKTNITCNGNSDGTVTATKTGGIGTFSYDLLFSPTSGGTFSATGLPTNGDSTGIYTGLGVGFYKVIVSEANGCNQTSSEVQITQPNAIVVSNVSQSTIGCKGGNATVTITATGGTGALSYTFDGVTNSTGIFTHKAGTSLTYSVTDANSCAAATGTFTIVEPNAIVVSNVSQSTIGCKGGNATVTITAAGGTGALSYTFDGVTNSTGIFTHKAGTSLAYSVTDANSCAAATGTFTIVEPNAIVVSNVSQSTIGCKGGNATVTITAAGGTGALSYTFDGVTNSTGIFTHKAGTSLAYSVTDANNCAAATGNFTIVEPNAIVVSNVSQSTIGCKGGNATVTITAAGGTGALSYTFDGVTNSTGIFTHKAGTSLAYSVTDANNCAAATGTFTIVEPNAIVVSNVSQSAIGCKGGNATVTITATGGTGALSYTFDGVTNSTGIFTHKAGTSLTYSVTDANNCAAATGTFTIVEPNAIVVSNVSQSTIGCKGGNATVTITATGGTGALSYTFDGVTNSTGIFTHNAGTSLTYSVTDANNCAAATGTFTIVEPNAIVVSNVSQSTIGCKGGDATVTITATGGTGALSYTFDGVTNSTGIFTHKAGTSLAYSVTDANNCAAATGNFTIVEPNAIVVSNVSQSTIGCKGGNATVTITATGGTGALSYTFDGVTNSTGIFTHKAGTSLAYSVTDANNCAAATGTFTIVEPNAIVVSNVSQSTIDCKGGDATVTITATGGTGALSYTFDGVTNSTGIFTHKAGTSLAYSVTDANNCAAATGTFTIVEPNAIVVSNVSQSTIGCKGGDATVTITATGGTGALSYTFDGVTNSTGIFTHKAGTSLAYSVTDANNCAAATGTFTIVEPNVIVVSNVSQSTIDCKGGDATVTIIATGGTGALSYTFDGVTNSTGIFTHKAGTSLAYSVTDANNCAAATGTFTIVEPNAIVVSNVSQSTIGCKGGDATVTITATGGTGALSYTFDGVTNSTGIFPHKAGTSLAYSVTDANNCAAATGTFTIVEPNVLLATVVKTDVICNGQNNGTITITSPTGGYGTYEYRLNSGNWQESGNFTGLAPAIYSVQIRDAANTACEITLGSQTISEPATLTCSIEKNKAVSSNGLSDGEATVTPVGGNGGYIYLWDNGETTAKATKLNEGLHTVTITDSKGCTTTCSETITQPEVLSCEVKQDSPVKCFGDSNGTATVTPKGGNFGYTYLWDNGETTAKAIALNVGSHTVTVTDQLGYKTTCNITIEQPEAVLSATAVIINNNNCTACNNGTINITVMGGTAPYTYLWSNGSITEDISNLSNGSYSVEITDSRGCKVSYPFVISESSINVTKDGTYVDSNQDGITNLGDVVTYNFVVKNTGTVDLTNVTISDNNATISGGPIASLAVGATDSTTFTGSHVITQAEINAGLIYNLANVTAKDPEEKTVTDTSSDPTPCTSCPKDSECPDCTITQLNQTPGLTVIKTATTTSFSKVGDIINYTITVKNSGNVTLNNITVKDPLTGLDTLIAILIPGATSDYTQSYTITQDDLNKGSVTNVAKADGFKPNETPISATDDEIVNEKANPIDAVNDNAGTVVGVNVTTPNVINVFTNDTLNGLAVNPADVNLTTVTPNPFLKMNDDGSIDVLPNAPAGVQTMVYKICEKLNNTNCDSATVTVNIEAPSMTVNGESICINDVPYFSYTTSANNFTPLNGLTITWKDNNGNVVATMTNLPLNGKVLWPGAVVDEKGNGIDWPGWLLVNGKWIQGADGFENLRPTASLTLTMNPSETIVVNYPPSDPLCTSRPTFRIDAVDDNAGTIVGVNVTTPNVINVFKNDTLNTDPVNPADVTLTTVTANPFLQLNADGTVDVLPNAPAGIQTMVYQICEKADTGNCDTATVTVNIETPTMTVTGQSICINDVPYFSYTSTANNFTPLNGLTLTWKDNNGNVVATMTNLPLNGKVLWPGAVVDQNGNGIDWPGWLLVNGKWIQGADGFENLRPTASVTMTLNPDTTVIVNYPPSDPLCTSRPTFKIDAVDDTAGPIDGINGATNVLNVLKNDTLNTDPVNPADITLTLVTPDPTGHITMAPNGSINLKDGTPAGVYTLVYQICENADTGNCDTATVTINVICNDKTKISGVVYNSDTNTPLANVPVNLIPQGTTPGPVLLQITNAQGQYNFTGVVPGDYLVQVQGAQLNIVFGLFPDTSSLFFTKLENCKYQVHDYPYSKSERPVLQGYVWYDVNNNGIEDEWYDANNDGLVTQNIPDANGNIDYSKWEWIDLNGDGSYKGTLNVGELNKVGFGNAKSPNIFVTGPNGYNKQVIIGLEGVWRDRPDTGLFGDYKVELKMDANLEAQSSALGATGLVKVLPGTTKIANSAKTGKATSFEVCGPTSGNPLATTLTVSDPTELTMDFGISCKMYADIVATPDVFNITNCTLDTQVRNALSNDLLNGSPSSITNFNFKLLSPVVSHINIDATGNIVFENGIPAGQYIFNYQVCEKANPTNCTTSTITINVTPLAAVTVTGTSYCNADTTLIDLNTSLPQGTPTGTWIDSNSTGGLNGNMLNAIGIPIGKYKYEYKIVGDCPKSIFLEISVNDDCKVLPCKALVVHNAISANEDGKNDYFQIDNIEDNACYKNVRVEVYNRWGVLVFERDNYNNEGNGFRGKSEGRTTISKNEGLPTGTYFYILSYDTDGVKVKKDGYLYLVK